MEGYITRSKAANAIVAAEGRPGSTRSSRSSREALRLRAEYEAEKKMVELKESLIQKELALKIAEIEDQDDDMHSISVKDNVNEWLSSNQNIAGTWPSKSADASAPCPAPAPVGASAASYRPAPAPAPLPAAAAALHPAPALASADTAASRPAPEPTPAPASSDIMRLADAITSMAIQKPRTVHYDLPPFDGRPVDWLSYRKAYENTAVAHSAYENIIRLQMSLRGAAKYAVEDLLRTASDPVDIIYALEEEFGHPNLLLESALQKIQDLPRVSDSGGELRHMTTVIRNCVYMLKNIKADGYLNNPQIIRDILSKLTPVQRAQYGEYVMRINDSDRNGEDLRISPNLYIVLEFLSHLSRASAYYVPLNTEPKTNTYRYRNTPAVGNIAAGAADTSRYHRRVHHQRVFTSVDLPEETSSSPSDPPSPRGRPARPRDNRSGYSPSTRNTRSVDIECALCGGNHHLPDCEEFRKKNVWERWDIVKVNKLCFKCIANTHSRYRCHAKRCAKCRYPHHSLLHYTRSSVETAAGGNAPAAAAPLYGLSAPSDDAGAAAESVTSMGERFTKTLLKVLPVTIVIDNVDVMCYALLDDGATVSLIDSSLSSNLSGPLSPLKIISARGNVVTDNSSCRVTALIRGPNGISHNISLRTIKNIDLPPQNVPARVFQNTHLKDLSYCEMIDAKPMILIGQDNWELIVNREIRQGKSGQPVASRTKLGWVVHGPLGITSQSVRESVNLIAEGHDDLYDLVKQQFELESIGIAEVSRKNIETERACKILDSTSRRIDGGWEVGLLWSRDEVHLPDNYDYAFKRLRGVESRMDKNPEYAAAYIGQVERLLNEKYAKLVDGSLNVSPVWWLPHFGVTNPNKPNRLRLVYDAAAKYEHVCLNDNLLTGPDLLNSLLGILFKFRSGPIAYTADIADMFLRIKIRKEDQGAQLFLWRGSDRKRDPDTYVMDSMIFGAKSSPTSAIFVLNKNALEFKDSHPEAVRAIQENHYMDDYLHSVQSIDVARQLISDVSMIHAAGGFNIRGWVTNSPELRHELPEIVPGSVNLDKSPNNAERTLGMIWVPESDDLGFDLSFKRLAPDIVAGRVVPTKRDFLRFIMSIYDPLGLLCPYVIKSRILLQKVWKSGICWDEELKDSEYEDWKRLLDDIKQLVNIRVPRWYGLSTSDVELHVFGDASELAYSAVAFLVGRDDHGKPTVAMVAGKVRVAPLKVISVPRLELQAAVLACRLACNVEKEQGLPIVRKYLWSDSKTVLKWIHSDPREFQKFVSHRLAEIDKKSNASDWRWVPSAENPADEATKAYWPTRCKLWFTGPPFLLRPKHEWPVNEYDDVPDSDVERLEKINVVKQLEPLIDVSRFSSWTRVVRAMARVLAFIGMCRKKQTQPLTAENIRESELFLLKQSQSESFSKEIKSLREGNPLPVDSKVRNLDPIIFEDGLLRVRGRLSAAVDLSFEEKHPIILDGHSYVVQLLVLHYHVRAHHANNECVINCVREKYWITRMRLTLKSVVARCQFCRVRRLLPNPPKMGDLPSARVQNTRRAFVHCGIDYFGPMEVAIGRRREKRWGVIFTCLVTRAVHVELAASLSADSAIMAIRRFVARRGQPVCMFSDRGTNFVGADAELKAALRNMEHSEVQEFVVTKGISWQFNPPAAPHMGGCWERLVRSIKTALKVTLKERVTKEEVLITLLAEVEMMINSRPLTYVSSEPGDPIALTPNHLLLGTASGASTLGTFDASDLNGRKAWRKAQALADAFWKRWLREYLPTLQRRQKWLNETPPVKVGDLVLIVDTNQARNTWPRGIINAVHPGHDGHIRVVTVQTAKGCVKRPVVKVVVLPTDEDVCKTGGGNVGNLQ